MEVYVLSIIDYCNDAREVIVFDSFDKAINAIVYELRAIYHMNEDDTYATEEEFNDIVDSMKEAVDRLGYCNDDSVYFVVDKREVK